MAPKRGLGRGLSNLIPTDDTIEDISTKTSKQTKASTTAKTEVIKKVEQTLNINRIEPNKNQPRKEFNEDALQELAESIKQFGVIEPLVVVKRKGYYELIAGERRWRAARLAGLKEVPVVIKDYDETSYARMKHPLGLGNTKMQDYLFSVQQCIISEIATKEESCIIVGRCSDYR